MTVFCVGGLNGLRWYDDMPQCEDRIVDVVVLAVYAPVAFVSVGSTGDFYNLGVLLIETVNMVVNESAACFFSFGAGGEICLVTWPSPWAALSLFWAALSPQSSAMTAPSAFPCRL